jgi:prepilin-type N-terminal cleavage/methylation domain-containing protein
MVTHEDARGFTLLETIVAVGIVVTVASGVAGLLMWASRSAWGAGVQGTAVWLAQQKLEQLGALDWRIDTSGLRVSDTTTNLSVEPAASDGTGLLPSPGSSLDQNTSGFFDFVGGAYVRRWSIAPFAGDPQDTLLLAVVVLPLAESSGSRRGALHAATLRTARTRVRH